MKASNFRRFKDNKNAGMLSTQRKGMIADCRNLSGRITIILAQNGAAQIISEVLGRPIRFRQVTGEACKAAMMQHGMTFFT
ncbi:hypothetical protein [Paenibacillus hamazuiensis]|uniref:hypothetical protein n=1 Tax=Paenibacillus hamazuiensis TaxID=2936508 RepID=UPI00200F053B|nr:hypothetical protein [Paenibacillus hamazuiensis]